MKKTIVMAAMAACMFVSNVFAQKTKEATLAFL